MLCEIEHRFSGLAAPSARAVAASDLGLSTLRLETNSSLKEAQQLYRRSGYREVKPFNDEPYAHHWFEKSVLPKRRRRVS